MIKKLVLKISNIFSNKLLNLFVNMVYHAIKLINKTWHKKACNIFVKVENYDTLEEEYK